MFTVYALVDPRNGLVRYIGITDDVYRRFREHIACDGRNRSKDAWIDGLKHAQMMLIMQTLEAVETVEQAREQEKYWVQHYRSIGANLLNHTILPKRTVKTTLQTEMPLFEKIGAAQRRRFEDVGPDGIEPVKEVVLFRHLHGRYWPGLSRDMEDYYEFFYFTRPNKRRDGKKHARHLKCWERRMKWLAELESISQDEHPLVPVTPSGGRDYPDLEEGE